MKPFRERQEKGIHVSFSGIDGSGKSTQAGLLYKKLSTSGIPCFLMRTNTEFSIQLMNAIAFQHNVGSGRIFFGHGLYNFAKFFDYARDYFSYVQPLTNIGTNVIVPRAKSCHIARAKALNAWPDRKLAALYDSIPGADMEFYLDVQPPIAKDRIDKRGRDSEDLGYLRELKCAFDSIADEEKLIHIDGNRETREVSKHIYDLCVQFADRKVHT